MWILFEPYSKPPVSMISRKFFRFPVKTANSLENALELLLTSGHQRFILRAVPEKCSNFHTVSFRNIFSSVRFREFRRYFHDYFSLQGFKAYDSMVSSNFSHFIQWNWCIHVIFQPSSRIQGPRINRFPVIFSAFKDSRPTIWWFQAIFHTSSLQCFETLIVDSPLSVD